MKKIVFTIALTAGIATNANADFSVTNMVGKISDKIKDTISDENGTDFNTSNLKIDTMVNKMTDMVDEISDKVKDTISDKNGTDFDIDDLEVGE